MADASTHPPPFPPVAEAGRSSRPPARPWSGEGAWRNSSRLVRLYRLARTRNPVTFNDKVRYKMLRDRSALMVRFADKAAMREYVAAVVGEDHLPRALALLTSADELAGVQLPREFVLKPTHGSGACVVVSDGAPGVARLPDPRWGWTYTLVRPEHAPTAALVDIAAGWLDKRYGRGPNHEWAYGLARRQLLVEELLRDPSGDLPVDVKLFVFHGHCRFVQVDAGRFGARTQDFFDSSWRPLAMTGGHPVSVPPPVRPDRLEQMVQLAETLARETDFVRVDLYHLPDRVLVGELTSSPAGGDSPFHPPWWNAEFGASWTVPRRYR